MGGICGQCAARQRCTAQLRDNCVTGLHQSAQLLGSGGTHPRGESVGELGVPRLPPAGHFHCFLTRDLCMGAGGVGCARLLPGQSAPHTLVCACTACASSRLPWGSSLLLRTREPDKEGSCWLAYHCRQLRDIRADIHRAELELCHNGQACSTQRGPGRGSMLERGMAAASQLPAASALAPQQAMPSWIHTTSHPCCCQTEPALLTPAAAAARCPQPGSGIGAEAG